MTVARNTGFGHQLRINEKSFGSCKSNIEAAMMSILDQKNENESARELFSDLSKCFEKAIALQCACEEKYNQNN